MRLAHSTLIEGLPSPGCAVAWDGHFKTQTEGDTFASVIDCVLNCACFVYIGAWLPFGFYNSEGLGISSSRLIVLTVVILFIRRIPFLLLLYKWIPEITSWKEALFSGHFGKFGSACGHKQLKNVNRTSQCLSSLELG